MQHIQLIKPDVFVKFTNQLKTTDPEVETLRYASPTYRELAVTAQ